jgi:hypothetical protein
MDQQSQSVYPLHSLRSLPPGGGSHNVFNCCTFSLLIWFQNSLQSLPKIYPDSTNPHSFRADGYITDLDSYYSFRFHSRLKYLQILIDPRRLFRWICALFHTSVVWLIFSRKRDSFIWTFLNYFEERLDCLVSKDYNTIQLQHYAYRT